MDVVVGIVAATTGSADKQIFSLCGVGKVPKRPSTQLLAACAVKCRRCFHSEYIGGITFLGAAALSGRIHHIGDKAAAGWTETTLHAQCQSTIEKSFTVVAQSLEKEDVSGSVGSATEASLDISNSWIKCLSEIRD